MGNRCEECRWFILNNLCLLGRKLEECDTSEARRGDDGLAVKLLDAYKEGRLQEEKLREICEKYEEERNKQKSKL
ncbi:MAG: hypothetical protein Q8M92_09780 [Candidatus Subteraquimicrobiales bacterium]|nr:hypothetical protein [Candidatus Subteraquimicrobiales bacterium]